MIRSRLLLVSVALPLLLGACHKKKPAVAATPVDTARPPVAPPVAPVERPTNTSTTDPNAAAREAAARARTAMLSVIYFQYDADDLSDEAKANLDEKIRILNANPDVRIRISGHCDERGSDEYNIALGRRRAESAKRYLADRGIDASRMETTTYGRERPAVQGSGEESWSRNRRDEFEITSGGTMLKAP